jgi:hypothetical protein
MGFNFFGSCINVDVEILELPNTELIKKPPFVGKSFNFNSVREHKNIGNESTDSHTLKEASVEKVTPRKSASN